MPDFGPDFCMEHSIANERQGVNWIERDDTHCPHEGKCCWCGRSTERASGATHGPHAQKTRKRKKAEAIAPLAPIEAEPVDGGAARMRKPTNERRDGRRHDDGHDYENTFFDMYYDDPW